MEVQAHIKVHSCPNENLEVFKIYEVKSLKLINNIAEMSTDDK